MKKKLDTFKSRLNKISIAVSIDRVGDIEEAAIVFMNKTKVAKITLLSASFDEDDDDLGSKIINEESDSRFVDSDVDITCTNVDSNVESMIDVICDTIDNYAHDEYLPEFDYILYIDKFKNNDQTVQFKDMLCEELTNFDTDYTPTTFSELFNNTTLERVLDNYNVNHTYSADSTLSAAIWHSLAFDIVAQSN